MWLIREANKKSEHYVQASEVAYIEPKLDWNIH